MMADLVADNGADAAIVDRRIGLGVEKGRLQDGGWKDDLVHSEIGVGFARHRGHRPFPAPARPAKPANIVSFRELFATRRIAQQLVCPDPHLAIILPLFGLAYLGVEIPNLCSALPLVS